MRFRLAVAAAIAAIACPAVAKDYESEVIGRNKLWVVEMVAWTDGSMGCVAQVSAPGESFLIWTFQDRTVQLQFFSEGWAFGEGDTANLQVQIDKKPFWNLTNAELRLNSVLFTLPDSEAGGEFIAEVAAGNRLFLRTEEGEDVQNYSLAGSRASIDSLLDCGEVILGGGSGNPFQ